MALELPVDLYTPTVGNAEVGQRFFVTPWSLTVDRHGRMFVSGASLRTAEEAGTSYLPVERRADGVAVDLSAARGRGHTWSPADEPYCGNGVDTSELLPVVELLDEPV